MVTVTSSPGFRMFLVQPSLASFPGAKVSETQGMMSPFSSFTLILIRLWGLAQTNSVTAPFKVIGFASSSAAVPWCARTGLQAARRLIATAKNVITLLFMPDFTVYWLQTGHNIHPARDARNHSSRKG